MTGHELRKLLQQSVQAVHTVYCQQTNKLFSIDEIWELNDILEKFFVKVSEAHA